MTRIELPFYAAVSLCTGPLLFLRGFRDLRTRRLIQNTPTAKIRSMSMGLVEISGTVLERSLVRAPFSGRECAYWEVDVSLRAHRRHGWSTVYRSSSGNPFFVSDGTGVALVYPQGSMCKVPAGSEEECLGIALPEVYESFLNERCPWRRQLWRLGTLRFRERTLEEGQPVYILGSAEPRAQAREVSAVPAMELGADVAWAEPEVRATGTDGPVVTGLDALPGMARARQQARERALDLDAPRPVGHASAAPDRSDPRAPVIPIRGAGRVRALHGQVSAVIRRGRNEPTFIISAESESSLTLGLGLTTFFKVIGGPVLTAFGLGYWLLAMSTRHIVH